MTSISIFAKRAFLNVDATHEFEYKGESPKRGHLLRVSSIIRADQIADYLGAKLNPEDGYQDDVCIYVKPHVKNDEDFKFEGKPYVDVIDGWGLIPLLKKYPNIPLIACSKQDQKILSRILPNKVVLIPQHHCNFERQVRNRQGIKTIGVIGTAGAFGYLPEGLEKALAEKGIQLLTYSKFFTREDIVNFYKSIDIQIVWRPYRMRLSNPLKLVNAASFGIPSVVYDESVFQEVLGCYLRAKNLPEILDLVSDLIKFPDLYNDYSATCLKIADNYHIDNIAELYRQL
jgi:hypothetical protein